MLLPNVSPTETERTRYDLKHKKYIYFCYNCLRNSESHDKLNKCRFCKSDKIKAVQKGSIVKKTKISTAKEDTYNKVMRIAGEEHIAAKGFEKILNFIKRRI